MRESRSSGSAEGVVSNRDPYSDSPEPVVVKQPKFTRVEEPTLLWNQVAGAFWRHAAKDRGAVAIEQVTDQGRQRIERSGVIR